MNYIREEEVDRVSYCMRVAFVCSLAPFGLRGLLINQLSRSDHVQGGDSSYSIRTNKLSDCTYAVLIEVLVA